MASSRVLALPAGTRATAFSRPTRLARPACCRRARVNGSESTVAGESEKAALRRRLLEMILRNEQRRRVTPR